MKKATLFCVLTVCLIAATFFGLTAYLMAATASSTANVKAEITSPTAGSTFASSSVKFEWSSGTGVEQYFLYVGKSPAWGEYYAQDQGTNRSVTVNGLPEDGSTVFVRLWSRIGNDWQYSDYTYRARATGGIPSGGIIMWSGDISKIPAGWKLCDGSNGTPDLRDRFVVGAGTSYSTGATGGSISHSHGTSGFGSGYAGQPRNIDASSHLPPYFALAFIMKE